MELLEPIKKLRELGYVINTANGRLFYEFKGADEPEPKIAHSLLSKLKESKQQIIEHLKKEVENITVEEFSKRGLAVRVENNVLGEEVYFVSNEKMREQVKDHGLVTYFPHELKHLIKSNPTPNELRKIHLIKKTFDGSKIVEDKKRRE